MSPDARVGTPETDVGAVSGLRIERSSTAERVADGLRDLILRGDIKPGSPLREGDMVGVLDVSRNTVREAFRLLGRDGLVVHQMHRGVVVKALSEGDVRDIYATRMVLELAAVARATDADEQALESLSSIVGRAQEAAAAKDWKTVATMDLMLHQGIVGLLGSERIDVFFRGILAELRLAFAVMPEQERLLSPFVPWNHKLAELLQARDVTTCEAELVAYLGEAQRLVLAGVASARDVDEL